MGDLVELGIIDPTKVVPPLSKQLLRGVQAKEKLPVHTEAYYRVHAVDTANRIVRTDGAEDIHFNKLAFPRESTVNFCLTPPTYARLSRRPQKGRQVEKSDVWYPHDEGPYRPPSGKLC